jgi:hypothetical protein
MWPKTLGRWCNDLFCKTLAIPDVADKLTDLHAFRILFIDVSRMNVIRIWLTPNHYVNWKA